VHINALTNLIGQVQSGAIPFQHIDNAQALFVMAECASHRVRKRRFASMTKRRMTEIMSQTDCLDQVFVETQGARHRTRDLGHFQCMRQARAIVIALWRDEYLRFMFQPTKRFRVQNAIAVALKTAAHRRWRFRARTTGAIAKRCQGRKTCAFVCFDPFAYTRMWSGHAEPPAPTRFRIPLLLMDGLNSTPDGNGRYVASPAGRSDASDIVRRFTERCNAVTSAAISCSTTIDSK
jgi:hypothetical protein